MSLTTPRAIIDAARTRHWSFSSLALGDGAALLFLRSRVVTHIAQHGAKIEGLVGTAMSYAIPTNTPVRLVSDGGAILASTYGQQIVASSGTATPRVGDLYADGWPVHISDTGVPYVDFSETPLAADPFGEFGGTVGFPLPADMIRLIAVALVYSANQIIPCDVVSEPQRFTTLPGRNPACFVSSNRLVPVQPLASGNTGGRWANCTEIQISYVGLQALATLDELVNLPSVLVEALIADLAQYLAMQSKDCPPNDKRLLLDEAHRCAAIIGDAALDLLNEPMQTSVQYRG